MRCVRLVEAALPVDKLQGQSASSGRNQAIVVSLNSRGKILGESNIELFVIERSQDIDIVVLLHRHISRGECPEKPLNRADVVAIFQEMSGEAMTHGVRAGWLRDASLEPSIFDGLLEDRFMEVMSALFSCDPVGVMAGGRKHPLPSPFLIRVRIFSVQSVGQHDTPQSFLQILFVQSFDVPKMFVQHVLYGGWKHRMAVLITFAGSNHDLVLRKVDILDP